MQILNPATGQLVKEVSADSIETLKKKFESARKAQKAWSAMPLAERIKCVRGFAEKSLAQVESLAKDMSLETGKPVHQAAGEIKANIARIDYFCENVAQAMATERMLDDEQNYEDISYEPLGVVANISAWNFPFFVSTNVVVPALLTGNAVLFKPSEFATLTGLNMTRLLHESGVPQDVLACVVGAGDIGAKLLELDLKGVYFTGSYTTGKRIAEAVAGKMCKLQLELGGKDPSYIPEDNDPKKVAPQVGDGCFYNAGQSCCAVERIYAHEKIYDEFTEELASFAKSLTVGSPDNKDTYLGPLTRKQQIKVLEDQVADAVEKGAKVLAGGKSTGDMGAWFEPTVLGDVNHTMKVMREESFGPIIGVQKVKDDAEAITLMNDTSYGLTASVYTPSEERARSILSEIDSGTVYWNCCDRVSPFVPWSGRKHSGLGSTLSLVGIRAFLQPKSWQMRKQ